MKVLHYCVGNSDLNLLSEFDLKFAQFRFKDYYSITKLLSENIINKLDSIIINENDIFNYKKYIDISKFKQKFNYSNAANKSNTFEVEKVNYIYFPIFNAILNKLCNKKHNIFRQIEKIFLYATDQNDVSVEPDDKEKDTLYVAKLLKVYIESLPERNPDVDVEIVPINHSPFDYNCMAKYFESFINKNERLISRVQENIINITSGTPAMYNTLSFIMKKYSVKYLYVPMKKNQAKEVDYYIKINEDYYRTLIFQSIDTYNYSNTIGLIKESPFRISKKDIIPIIKLQNERLKFNFNKMNDIIRQEIDETKFGKLNDFFNIIRKFDVGNKTKNKFNELLQHIDMSLKNENYISLLSFVYTFMENLSEYLINNNPLINDDLPLPYSKNKKYETFKKLFIDNFEILSQLENNFKTIKEDYEKYGMTKKIVDAVLKILYKSDENSVIDDYFTLCDKLKGLFEMRNRFIHSFKTNFEFPYSSTSDLLKDLKNIAKSFNVYSEKYPSFEYINNFIKMYFN